MSERSETRAAAATEAAPTPRGALVATGVALRVARARVRDTPTRVVLTAIGVGLALAVLVLTIAARTLAGDLELRRALDALPPGARSVAVSYSGATGTSDISQRDRVARHALSAITATPPRRVVLLRTLAATNEQLYSVAGIDGLAGSVRLRSGRLPRSCTPTACEALALGDVTPPELDPDIGIRVVGRATLTDPSLLGGTFDPGANTTVIAVDGVAAADRIASLDAILRSHGWIVPIDPASVRVATMAGLLARLGTGADIASNDGLRMTAPDDQLASAAAVARAAARRLLLVGGECAALLLAFAAVAAFGLRRGHRAALDLLADRGASRRVLGVFTLAEGLWPILVGGALGVAGGVAATLALADSEDVGGRSLLGDALGGRTWLWLVAGLAVALGVVVLALRSGSGAATRGLRPMDVAGIAAGGAAILAAARGSASPADLAAKADPLVAALPALVLVAAAVAGARLAPLALGALGRIVPPRAALARLALADAGRPATRSRVTIAFLVAATGAAVLAFAYRETLDRGAREQAAFSVPLDARLTVGQALVRPTDLGAEAAYAKLVPGTVAGDVVRRTASVRVGGTTAGTASLLGVTPDALRAFATWRADLGPAPADVAGLIAWNGNPTRRGAAIPTGAKTVTLAIGGLGTRLMLRIVIVSPDGRMQEVDAREVDGGGQIDMPDARPGWKLVGFRILESLDSARGVQHHAGEGGGNSDAAEGTITVGDATAAPGGTVPIAWPTLLATGGSYKAKGTGGAVLDVALQGGTMLVTYPQPGAGAVIPVLTDPTTAAAVREGVLDLDLGGVVAQARVVAIGRSFPTVGGQFVIADERLLSAVLDAAQPGYGTPDELWLRAGSTADDARLEAALTRSPYDQLVRGSRRAIEADLRADPLARAATGLLLVAGVLGLVLAAVAIGIAAAAARRDDAAALYALEADGARPAQLRRLLFLRGAALVVCALPVGVVAGVILVRAVTSLIAVTATAAVPQPPLATAGALTLGLAAIAVAGGVALAASAAAAAVAFREPLPPTEDAALR